MMSVGLIVVKVIHYPWWNYIIPMESEECFRLGFNPKRVCAHMESFFHPDNGHAAKQKDVDHCTDRIFMMADTLPQLKQHKSVLEDTAQSQNLWNTRTKKPESNKTQDPKLQS